MNHLSFLDCTRLVILDTCDLCVSRIGAELSFVPETRRNVKEGSQKSKDQSNEVFDGNEFHKCK